MNMYNVNCEWCSGIISGLHSCAIGLKTSKKCVNQGFLKNSATIRHFGKFSYFKVNLKFQNINFADMSKIEWKMSE